MTSPLTQPSSRGLRLRLLTAAMALGLVLIFGLNSRAEQTELLAQHNAAQQTVFVATTTPTQAPAQLHQTFSGRAQAWNTAQIYARVGGYLARWHVDIGQAVTENQLLAEIDAAELSQQLQEAQALLLQAQSQAALAETTLKRWQTLALSQAVSAQALDEQQGNAHVARASVQAAEARVQQLKVQLGYARVKAPFAGVVIKRNAQQGALVSADGVDRLPLFELADLSRMRVLVDVPQHLSHQLTIGASADVVLPEFTAQPMSAQVQAFAGAVDSSTGTMQLHLQVDKPLTGLKPGSFVQVILHVAAEKSRLLIPASALIFNADGLFVATVDKQQKVQLKPIQIAQDLGQQIAVHTGLQTTDQVIVNPPDGVLPGQIVTIVGK